MAFIIKEKRKNSIYVYEAESYRDENGKPRKKKKYLGRLDGDGVLITSKRKLPVKITEVRKVTTKFIMSDK